MAPGSESGTSRSDGVDRLGSESERGLLFVGSYQLLGTFTS
jgi:hypothetical protein